jgi:hypothetical protein
MYAIAIRLITNKKNNIDGAIDDTFDSIVVVDLSSGDLIDVVGTEQIMASTVVEAELVVDSSVKMAFLVDFRNEFSLGLLSLLFVTDTSFDDDNIDGDSLTTTTAGVNNADADDTTGLIAATLIVAPLSLLRRSSLVRRARLVSASSSSGTAWGRRLAAIVLHSVEFCLELVPAKFDIKNI